MPVGMLIMGDEMGLYKKHVFICVNKRDENDPKGSCAQKDSELFFRYLKEEIKSRKLHIKIRINKAGCLGTCNQGISMVIYPEGIWYGKVRQEDIHVIIEKTLLKDEIVDRLLMPFMRKKNLNTL